MPDLIDVIPDANDFILMSLGGQLKAISRSAFLTNFINGSGFGVAPDPHDGVIMSVGVRDLTIGKTAFVNNFVGGLLNTIPDKNDFVLMSIGGRRIAVTRDNFIAGGWAVAGAVPVNTVAPVASGSTIVGQTVSVTDGTWSNSPTGFTYQWFANGVAIGGATANTFLITSTQLGANLNAEVTASNASGNSTPAASNTIGPVTAAFVPGFAPLTMDEFSVAHAAIAGQTVEPYHGALWAQDPTTTAVTSEPNISTNNMRSATFNANNQKCIGYLTPAVLATNERAIWSVDPTNYAVLSTNNGHNLKFYTNFGLVSAGNWQRVSINWQPGTQGGTISGAVSVAGGIDSGGTNLTWITGAGTAAGIYGGDVVTVVETTAAGARTNSVELNGRSIRVSSTNLNTVGSFTVNGSAGVEGGFPDPKFALKRVVIGNQDTEAFIWAAHGGRIMSIRGTNCTLRMKWLYFGPTLPTLPITIRNGATGAALAGLTSVTMTNEVVTAPAGSTPGTVTGYINIPLSSLPATNGHIYAEAEMPAQDSGGNARTVKAQTTSQKAGKNIFVYGQSRVTKQFDEQFGSAYTDPPNSWGSDACGNSSGYPTVAADRRVNHSSTVVTSARSDRAHMYMCSSTVMGGWYGTTTFACNMYFAGAGGKDAIDRQIGSTYWTAAEDGIDLACDVDTVIFPDHAFEADNGNGNWPATWNAAAETQWFGILNAEVARITALTGFAPNNVIVMPSCTIQGTSVNDRADAFNRSVTKICSTNGWTLGPSTDDAQHNTIASGDNKYHLAHNYTGKGILTFRMGSTVAYLDGVLNWPREGARLVQGSGVRVGTTITVTMSAPYALTAAIEGSNASTDFRGGCHMYSGPTLASGLEVLPSSGPVLGTMLNPGTAGATFTVSWVMPIAQAYWVTGAKGEDPLNSANDPTTADAMIAMAARITVDRGDPSIGTINFNPPVERFYDLLGTTDSVPTN